MLEKDFPQTPRTARCGKPLFLWFGRLLGCTQQGLPLRIAEPDIRCPRIELRAAGTLICIRRLLYSSRFATFCFSLSMYGRLDSAGTPWLRIALPDTRCPRVELRALG